MNDSDKATAVALLLEYLRTHGVSAKEAMHLLRPEAVRWWYAMKENK